MDEHQLIEKVLVGDAAAERLFYDIHVERVFRLAYRMTGDETLAQDLTQETFVRAFRKLSGFRRESALSTWLHSITVSVVLTAMKKLKRHRERETVIEAAENQPQSAPPRDVDLHRVLSRAIDRLSDLYRTIFVLHDVEGYTHEEIGTILQIPVGTSKARLSRARASLREGLQGLKAGSST